MHQPGMVIFYAVLQICSSPDGNEVSSATVSADVDTMDGGGSPVLVEFTMPRQVSLNAKPDPTV